MRVLIIEDELLAQEKLEAMLLKLDPDVTVAACLTSVKDAIAWLGQHPHPDVAFVDIQLSDDHSFEIFRKKKIEFPVVFTTAYDRYLLESFEFNSIDYLLKPITEEKLQRSLRKLRTFEHHFNANIHTVVNHLEPQAISRIVVRKGTDFIAVPHAEVSYFFTEHRIVFVRDHNGRQYIADKNLAALEELLDPKDFFRLNRKYIANISAIEKYKPEAGRIRVFLKPGVKEEIYISKETAPAFRKWIGA